MTLSKMIPPALAGRPNWMGTKPGEKKPHSIRPGHNGEWKTPEAYADFPDVLDSLERGQIERIGFVFRKDSGFICLDLDKVRNAETGEVAEWAQRVVDQFTGIAYIELSLSGQGFHIIFEGHKLDWMKSTTKTVGTPNPESKFECFDEKFVILTGDIVEVSLRDFGNGQEIFERVYAGFFSRDASGENKSYGNEREIAVSALKGLNPFRADDYEIWLNIGMALHSVSADLIPEWEEWSRKSSKFIEGDCQKRWGSFSGDQGITIGTLIFLAKQDGWKPPHGSQICNGFSKENRVVPVPMGSIIERIKKETGDWPRKVGNALFVHEDSNRIDWLENPSALFGYVGSKTKRPPKFLKSPGLHTKAEVYAEVQRGATDYHCVEELPHSPKMPGHYYACSFPEPGDGKHLNELIGRFNPETEIDLDFIKAYFVSIFWGGAGGTKPAFLFDSPDGRGSGKTTIATTGGYLGNGHVELSANESAEVIKQRLLSPEGFTRRVALLDNVKSLRFSWSELESLITASVISGKRLYVGEARRPNNLVWSITLNGASLSTDLAQRCVIIRIKRPKHSGTWLEDTRKFIDDHRQKIIGDIIGFLQSERHPLTKYSRWGAWEREVLERLPEPAEAQSVILERQGTADIEVEESEILEDFIAKQLHRFDYCPEADRVFVPSSIMCRWYNEATNDRMKIQSVSRVIKQKITEGKLPHIVVCKHRSYGRGFEWIGDEWVNTSATLSDLESRIELILGRGDKRG